MKEIKFRAWDINKSRMYQWDEISHHPLWWFSTSSIPPSPTERSIMQFTGLYDKHGKEIWEGDICEIEAEDGHWNRFIVRFGIAQREMASGWVVDIPAFYFDLIGGKFKAFPIINNYRGMHDLEMTEIIGNIYENSNLLSEPASP